MTLNDADPDSLLSDLEKRYDQLSDACMNRSALRVAKEMVRIARQNGSLSHYMLALFKQMIKARAVLDPEMGCDVAVELIALLESPERARQIESDYDEEAYEQNIAWMSSCAYDNLAVNTARRQGYNSPGMQACINSGLDICRRTGKLQCIACFREYSTDVTRAMDDLDMALHYARMVSGMSDESPGAYRRWVGASDEASLLMLKGQLGPALQVCEQVRLLAPHYHNPLEAARDTRVLIEQIELLAGRRPPVVAELSPRDLPPDEDANQDFAWDMRDSLADAIAGQFDAAEKRLIPWDRRLHAQNCLSDWFEVRLRLAAIARLRNDERKLHALAAPLQDRAKTACDWLTIRRLERLLDPTMAVNAFATVGELTLDDSAATASPITILNQNRASADTDTSFDPSLLADAKEPDNRGPEIPDTPLTELLTTLASRLAEHNESPQIRTQLGEELRAIPLQDVVHPFDAGWILHLMYHAISASVDFADLWTWALKVAEPHPQDARVLNTLANLAAMINMQSPTNGVCPSSSEIAAMFVRSLDLDPTLPRNFARAGSFYLDIDDLAEAERCFARAFRLDRTNAAVASRLASLYEDSERPRDAMAVLDLAIREGCNDPPILWQAAMLAFAQDQYEPMRMYLDQFEVLYSGNPWTQHYRALALLEFEEYEEAEKALDLEFQRSPEQPLSYEPLRVCAAALMGRNDEAESRLKQLVQRRFVEHTYLTHRGFIGLYNRVWKWTVSLGKDSPARIELGILLLKSGLAPDELFEEQAPFGDTQETTLFRVIVRQPLDDNWSKSPGCLPGQEEWKSYIGLWGVLATGVIEATELALAAQKRCYHLPAEVEAVEPQGDNYNEVPRVVFQGYRFVPDEFSQLPQFDDDDDSDDDLDNDGLDEFDDDDDFDGKLSTVDPLEPFDFGEEDDTFVSDDTHDEPIGDTPLDDRLPDSETLDDQPDDGLDEESDGQDTTDDGKKPRN